MSTRGILADQIERSVPRLDATRLPQYAAAAETFRQRIADLETFLDQNATPEVFALWRKHAQWDAVVAAMDTDQKPSTIGRGALDLRYRLVGLMPGLELQAFQNLRSANEQLIHSIRFRKPDAALKLITRQMESTSTSMRDPEEPSVDAVAQVDELLQLLSDANQTPDLIAQIRRSFGHPNVVVRIDETLVQEFAQRMVNQRRPVNDCILGTRIVGTADLKGRVSADLKPAPSGLRVDLILRGDFQSNNTGYNGPIRLSTLGRGNVFASRSLFWSPPGAIRLTPTYSNAALNTQVLSIEPTKRFGRRLVKKVASKRVAEQKPQADQIAVGRLWQQVGKQFDEQTAQAGAIRPPDLMKNLSPFLGRLNLATPMRSISSSETEVRAEALIAGVQQLSAPSGFSGATVRNTIVVEVHESALANAIKPALAGRSLTRNQLRGLLKRYGISIAPRASNTSASKQDDALELDDGESGDGGDQDFTIDFDRNRPVIFEARRGKIRLGIRGNRFETESREIKRSLELFATYVPARRDDGTMILVREGEGQVEFPGRRRLTVAQAGLRKTIQKRLADAFPETLLTRPLVIPTNVTQQVLAGRAVRIGQLQTSDGWISLGASL
ncbi:MAG: hypothetical protein AAF958_20445 [Planctomycetota bacterium]